MNNDLPGIRKEIHPITQSEVMEITIDLQFTCKVEPKLSVFNKYR